MKAMSDEGSAARWDAFTLDLAAEPVRLLSQRWHYEVPLFARLMRLLRPGSSILEVGCGAGASVLWLAARGYEAHGIDYRPAVVDVANDLARRLSSSATFGVGDAFALTGNYDLAFSTGVIEHWESDQVVAALREQARVARTVCAVVPTRNTRYTGEITDERFYGRRLPKLFSQADLEVSESFSYGHVPNFPNRALRKALPPVLFDALRERIPALAMSQAVIAHH